MAGSAASLAADVAVAEPTITGRTIAAWPSFSLIAAYELLMCQVRHAAEGNTSRQPRRPASLTPSRTEAAVDGRPAAMSRSDLAPDRRGTAARSVRVDAWKWAQDNRAEDGSLPSGTDIARQYDRHERWGRLVKRSGLSGDLSA